MVENFRHRERTGWKAFARILPTITIQKLNQIASTLVCGAELFEFGLSFVSGSRGVHLIFLFVYFYPI